MSEKIIAVAYECSRIVSVNYELHFGPLMADSALQHLLYLATLNIESNWTPSEEGISIWKWIQ